MRSLFLLLILFSANNSFCQLYPKGYFQAPLDIPLYLSGNFGEIRTNHFHTGLDIKTEGKEGLPVFASADGFISRIKVSATGYGNILYIDHPNGYTTAYAHLYSFNEAIAAYTEKKQYANRSFEVDLTLKPSELPVKKGDIIGLSGNSGSSGGPHLHYEIRETKSEKAVNPLLFGFNVSDQVKPNIAGIRVFALSEYSHVDTKDYAVYPAIGKNGVYNLKPGMAISAGGDIGFALHTTDMLDGNANKCGVYTIEMFFDDSLVHKQQMEKLDFNLNRYLNAHCDYKQFRRSKSSIHKCFLEPNNKLEIYPYTPTRGKISIKDNNEHSLKFVVTDVYGNSSEISTTVKGDNRKIFTGKKAGPGERLIEWNKRFNPMGPFYEIDFPANNVYHNEIVKLRDLGAVEGLYSHIIEFGNDDIPVHSNFRIRLLPVNLPESLAPFAFVAELNANNKVARFAGKKTDDKWMVGESRSLGKFAIAIDSISPFIKPINIEDGKEFFPGQSISFSASDSQSGIHSYNLYIDDTWALITYDAKYARFTYKINPEKILPGNHRLQFAVTDNVGNSRTFECNFILH